jgi:transposase
MKAYIGEWRIAEYKRLFMMAGIPMAPENLSPAQRQIVDLVQGQGLSYQQAADQLRISKSTVAATIRTLGLNVAATVSYKGYVPECLAPEHQRVREATALRALAEQDAKKKVAGPRAELAEQFREMSEKLVCVYDPKMAWGFYWIPRKLSEERWIVDHSS